MPFIYKHFDGFSALLVTVCKIYSWAQKKIIALFKKLATDQIKLSLEPQQYS